MRTRGTAVLQRLAFSVLLGLTLSIPLVATAVTARALAPPEPGAVVLEDPLTAPRVFGPPAACPSGRNLREFVGEGTIIKVTGRCTDSSTNASLAERIDGLTVPDGEIRLELKAVSGQDRVRFMLDVRALANRSDGSYTVRIDPAAGVAQLQRSTAGQLTILAERADLAGILSPTDWNAVAVRMEGPNLWLLLNDQPVLSASDATFETGMVSVALVRAGDPNDPQETAIVLRNIRISGLAGNAPRLPTYQQPGASAAAAPRVAPWLGDISFSYDRSGAGAVPAGGKLPDLSDGSIYGFFSWRNLPSGSRIGVRILWGGEVQEAFEFTPDTTDGRYRVGIISFNSPEGGARFTFADVSMILLLDGKELARGAVALP